MPPPSTEHNNKSARLQPDVVKNELLRLEKLGCVRRVSSVYSVRCVRCTVHNVYSKQRVHYTTHSVLSVRVSCVVCRSSTDHT